MKRAVPEGKLARAGIAGAAAVKLGASQLGHQLKRPFLSESRQQEEREALDDKNAGVLFNALSQLRGTALKVAQMMSMEADLLPEAYRLKLEKSCHQVPPLNRVLVRKVLLEEFGQPPEALFASFEADAFAAASLGQVHAATLLDGTPVAVKIQYPGVNVAIDSDMALMRQLMRSLPNSRLMLQSLEEIHARLREEVDYRLEAENTRWFQQHLASEGVQVPPVFMERCGNRVLTTGFVPGKHLEEWLGASPSQEVRDRAAQRLYDVFVHSALTLRRLHADPNPGNYLLAPDGAVTLIDFGCVKHLSPIFTAILPRLLRAYHDDDAAALFQAYRELGMLWGDDEKRLYEEVLRPFGSWLVEPLRQDDFDFGAHAEIGRAHV